MDQILFRDGQAEIEVTAYKETSPDVRFGSVVDVVVTNRKTATKVVSQKFDQVF